MNATYRAVTEVTPLQIIDTSKLFLPASNVPTSAINAFIENTNKINKIYLSFADDEKTWMPEIGSLILQGYMSAVESYFRAVVTSLINIDEHCRQKVESKTLSFALARSQRNSHLLPEALLENVSFSTAGTIEKVMNEYLGLDIKSQQDLKTVLPVYKRVCQIRHCCVHRFGKLGSQNALELGFDNHSHSIEQPFSPSIADTEVIADILQIFVKTFNNVLFREILDRTVKLGISGQQTWKWTWDFRRDRRRFTEYYLIFANSAVKPATPPVADIYRSFRDEKRAHVVAAEKRNSQ